jgi:hypothetical protein
MSGSNNRDGKGDTVKGAALSGAAEWSACTMLGAPPTPSFMSSRSGIT